LNLGEAQKLDFDRRFSVKRAGRKRGSVLQEGSEQRFMITKGACEA
jgi:hypothetical protein